MEVTATDTSVVAYLFWPYNREVDNTRGMVSPEIAQQQLESFAATVSRWQCPFATLVAGSWRIRWLFGPKLVAQLTESLLLM